MKLTDHVGTRKGTLVRLPAKNKEKSATKSFDKKLTRNLKRFDKSL